MFIGHFAAAFAGKALAPRVSLGSLFLAAQFLDLLWPALLLLGVERVRIAPGHTAVTPLAFEHYPVSHSLLGAAVWAALVGGLSWARPGGCRRAGAVLGLLVLSHWALDAIVHRPDLPVAPGSATLVGLGLWNSLPATLVTEVGLLALGVWLYARTTRAVDRVGRWSLWSLVALILVIEGANVFGPPPPGVDAVAWAGLAQWLLVLWGYWIDRHRVDAAPVRSAVKNA